MKRLFTVLVCWAISLQAPAQENFDQCSDTPAISVCLPLKSLSLNSGFGYRIHPVTGKYTFHAGVDLSAHQDTVYAVLPGVVKAGYNVFLGIYIKIGNGDLQTIYGHLSRIFTITGNLVKAGTPIAVTGNTGRTTGEHLHFAIKYKQEYLNPLLFLSALIKQCRGP